MDIKLPELTEAEKLKAKEKTNIGLLSFILALPSACITWYIVISVVPENWETFLLTSEEGDKLNMYSTIITGGIYIFYVLIYFYFFKKIKKAFTAKKDVNTEDAE